MNGMPAGNPGTKRDDINPLVEAAGAILTQIAALNRSKVRAFPIADTDPEQPEPTSSLSC
jgi:hypothetical protein